MLCNALIQSRVDYACPAWCANLNEKRKKIQAMQNKCIFFCLKLDKMHVISEEEFKLINWSPTSKRVDQCINAITYNFVNNTCLYCLIEIFEFALRDQLSNFKRFWKKPKCWKRLGPRQLAKLLGFTNRVFSYFLTFLESIKLIQE